MLRLTDAHIILSAFAIAAGALLLIGLAAAVFVVVSGAWHAAREADRREAARVQAVADFRAADAAIPRARRGKQATGPMHRSKVRARAEILRQDLETTR